MSTVMAAAAEGSLFQQIVSWLTDGANWSGSEGILARIVEHLEYSAVSLLAAAVVAIPLGLVIGHTGRGKVLGVGVTGAMRAIPSLGLLFVAVMTIGDVLTGDAGLYLPVFAVLAILAVPPILAGTYAGIDQVDPAARDAAKGMGMRGSQVLWRVEVPCALPLIASGIRSATLQVIATATLAASVSLGGLGRFLIDGIQVRDYPQMAGGAVLVAALALLVDLALAGLQRLVVSPGLTGRAARRTGRRSADPADPTDSTQTTTGRTSGSTTEKAAS
jgi:osmoprotectant transport system permease protein